MAVRVSIIVPAYNEEKYIAKTLASVRSQTYKDYEIIVVNNNSKDRTAEIARRFTKKVVLEKKKGYHNAIKRGVKESTGEIITFCDADSLYPKDWLAKAIARIDSHPSCLGTFGVGRFYDGGFLVKHILGTIFTVGCMATTYLGFPTACGYNMIIKKKEYLRSGGYDPKIYNGTGLDVELGLRLSRQGKFLFSPSLVVFTSTRRVGEQGLAKTVAIYWNIWIVFVFNRKNKGSYEEYNKVAR